jgi:CheY-like chemotaxis protein
LGLAIVRHLVELHGGAIKADSAGVGEGATFTITLPLAPQSQNLRKRVTGSLRAEEVSQGHFTSLPLLDGVKVLLVDNDADTLQVVRAMLDGSKAVVQTAVSVNDAMEMLVWYNPHVLVSDLAMPDEDGYSLIRKVRILGANKGYQIPAIALTSYVRVEDRTRALAAGFNMFVPKPLQPDELITAIVNLADPSCEPD